MLFTYTFARMIGLAFGSRTTRAGEALALVAVLVLQGLRRGPVAPGQRARRDPTRLSALLLGAGSFVVAVLIAAVLAGPLAAALTALVLITGGSWLYKIRYAAAATAVKARLV